MTLRPLRFATTAARLAYSWSAQERNYGRECRDLQNGMIYKCKREGAGAASMINLSGVEVITEKIPLGSLRIISSGGDVGNIAAIGGVLGSDTVPILLGDAAESWEVSWATGSVIAVGGQLPITSDELDDTRDLTYEFDVYSGTTNAFGITVETSFNGAALVSDAASDTDTKSATRHTITATVAAADIPASVRHATFALTPTAAHATDAYKLCGMRIKYFRK